MLDVLGPLDELLATHAVGHVQILALTVNVMDESAVGVEGLGRKELANEAVE